MTRRQKYEQTLRLDAKIIEEGFNLVVRWEHERPCPCWNDPISLTKGNHSRQRSQAELITDWCDQLPVLGFNSGSFDLNLIKKYFVDRFIKQGADKVAKKEAKQCSCRPRRSNFLTFFFTPVLDQGLRCKARKVVVSL